MATKNTKTAKTTKTYMLISVLSKGIETDVFTFHADNDQDASHKAIGWAYYHGRTRDDVKTRLATADETANAENLHNEWIN